MIKVVCEICRAEEVTTVLSDDWRTVVSTQDAWVDPPRETHNPAHLCSTTCMARWAEAHGAKPRLLEGGPVDKGMADHLLRARNRQIDLRTLEEGTS